MNNYLTGEKNLQEDIFLNCGDELFSCNREFFVLPLCRLGKEKCDINPNISLKLIGILFMLARVFKPQLNGLSLTSQSP